MDAEHPLRPIVTSWLTKIQLAKDYKQKRFQNTANECMSFYNGPEAEMWDKYMKGIRGTITRNDGDEESVLPSLRFKLNKVAELVQLFGPALYHRNPTRKVNPREVPRLPPEVLLPPLPPDMAMAPMEQQQQAVMQQQMQLQLITQQQAQEDAVNAARSQLLETYLNYTPRELDLKRESRRVIDEALIKGMGCWWTEVYQPKGSAVRMVGSFYDTVDNLVLDPDVELIDDCSWIARKCCHPIWEVEDDYGFERDELKEYVKKDGNTFESFRGNGESTSDARSKDKFKRGETNDILTYWKVYSKMGMGDKLTGVDEDLKNSMAEFGDNCFLVVAEGVPFPLNLPDAVMLNKPTPSIMAQLDPVVAEQEAAAEQAWKDEIFQRTQWPIPFWADGSWPMTPLAFHEVPNCVWPMSHVAPALGELKWLNWAMSFLATKVRTSCKTTIAILKAAGEDLKQQYLNGGDNAVLELTQITGRNVNEVIQFLQQPPFHGDIYNVIAAVTESFEKRVGLTELAYGQTSSAYRSAAEANVKQGQFSIRPEDMANQVEDSMSDLARKEAIAARWLLTQEDVTPVLGQIGGQAWAGIVQSQDLETIVREFDYRIEAGSVRKPNKQARVDQMNQAIQTWGPFLQQYTFATADVKPIQAMLDDWCRAMDINPDRYALIPPMPPPPPGQEEEGGPTKKEQAA